MVCRFILYLPFGLRSLEEVIFELVFKLASTFLRQTQEKGISRAVRTGAEVES